MISRLQKTVFRVTGTRCADGSKTRHTVRAFRLAIINLFIDFCLILMATLLGLGGGITAGLSMKVCLVVLHFLGDPFSFGLPDELVMRIAVTAMASCGAFCGFAISAIDTSAMVADAWQSGLIGHGCPVCKAHGLPDLGIEDF